VALSFNEMRSSVDGRLFGTCSDGETIVIWDAVSLAQAATVTPRFGGGEERFVIDPGGHVIYSAVWEGSLSCYDYVANETRWHRPDLVGIQKVEVSPAFPSSLFVALETPDYRVGERGAFTGVMELDAATGATMWETRDGDYMFVHPSSPILVLVDEGETVIRILDGSRRLKGSAEMTYFAVLNIAFEHGVMALAEGKEGVRFVDFDGKVLATHKPRSREPNCIQVAFIGRTDTVAIVDAWASTFMTILDCDGRVVTEYERANHLGICFINEGTRFVDQEGMVFGTGNGALLARLPGAADSPSAPPTGPIAPIELPSWIRDSRQ
jgi:hypothetical protein